MGGKIVCVTIGRSSLFSIPCRRRGEIRQLVSHRIDSSSYNPLRIFAKFTLHLGWNILSGALSELEVSSTR